MMNRKEVSTAPSHVILEFLGWGDDLIVKKSQEWMSEQAMDIQ